MATSVIRAPSTIEPIQPDFWAPPPAESVISNNPAQLSPKPTSKAISADTKTGFCMCMPQPIDCPPERSAITAPAKGAKAENTAQQKAEESARRSPADSSACSIHELTLKIRTGKTQGMMFRISPPKSEAERQQKLHGQRPLNQAGASRRTLPAPRVDRRSG